MDKQDVRLVITAIVVLVICFGLTARMVGAISNLQAFLIESAALLVMGIQVAVAARRRQ